MVEYDVLGNERHKAICKLREMPELYPNKDGGADLYAWKSALANAIGADTELFSAIRDRLIHLLGGDQPKFSELFGILGEDDDGVASADSPICGDSTSCTCGDEVVPITTELREHMEPYRPIEDAGHVVVSRIGTIGFEGFDRLCDNIDAIHAGLEREVKKAWSEAKTQRNNFDQATSAREHWKTLYEQALEQIHDLEHDVEMWRDRAEDMRMERDDALQGRHRYPDICDADDVPIRIGDVMDFTKNVRGLTVLGIGIVNSNESGLGVFVREGNDYVWYNAEFLHHHVSTVEDVLWEFTNAWAKWKDGAAMMNPVETFAAKLKLADA